MYNSLDILLFGETKNEGALYLRFCQPGRSQVRNGANKDKQRGTFHHHAFTTAFICKKSPTLEGTAKCRPLTVGWMWRSPLIIVRMYSYPFPGSWLLS